MDWRKWIERAWPASQVAMARKVDCHVGGMSLDRKNELMREAVKVQWLPSMCMVEPRRAFVQLGTRRAIKLVGPAEDHLNMLQREAGLAFTEGDEEWRELACFSWHVYLSLFDIWPVMDEIGMPQLWRNTPPMEALIPLDAPTRVAEERPYGRFMYDTWSSAFEMERYFYNWCLRMARWTDYCVESKRFTVIERMPKRKRKAKNLTWTKGLGIPAPADETVGKYGLGRVSSGLVERLNDPSEWVESSMLRRGGGWPESWRNGLNEWLSRAPAKRKVWVDGEGFVEEPVDFNLFWATRLFSFLELSVRMDELWTFREWLKLGQGIESMIPYGSVDDPFVHECYSVVRSLDKRIETFVDQRFALVWDEFSQKVATDAVSEAEVMGIRWDF